MTGAVNFDDLIEKLKVKLGSLAKGGGKKKRFQCCLNPNSSNQFLYLRAIQGHSAGTLVDPLLQDNVLLLDDFAEYDLPHRERLRNVLHFSKWTDPMRKKQQKG